MACVVQGCKSHTGRKDDSNEFVTFHRFPKDEAIKKIWIQQIARYNWEPKKHSLVCSRHFTKDSFVLNKNLKYGRLKSNATPLLLLPEPIRKQMELTDSASSDKNYDIKDFCLRCKCRPLDYQENISSSDLSNTIVKTEDDGLNLSILKIRDLETELAIYKKKYLIMKKEVERVNKVSKRRLQRINTLIKRNSRLTKRNTQLFDILAEKFKEENVEFIDT